MGQNEEVHLQREEIIKNYIEGYNTFNIEKMIYDFAENVVFQNVLNGEISLTTNGIESFKQQAEVAKSYFISRNQNIVSFQHDYQTTKIEITYRAEFAIDFPNGLKKGDILALNGVSIFTFQKSKIIKLVDES